MASPTATLAGVNDEEGKLRANVLSLTPNSLRDRSHIRRTAILLIPFELEDLSKGANTH